MKKKPAAATVRERRVSHSDAPSFMFAPVHTRILARIDTGSRLAVKATAIVAPVGYGKTVLMSLLHARLRAREEPCYWIALDARNHSLDDLLGALDGLFYGDSGDFHPTQSLLRGDLPVDVRLDGLMDAIARQSAPFTLFIDNLNVCTDPGLEALLDRLVFDTPETVRLVVTSTSDLPMNRGRAKLEGRLQQVDYDDLSLDAGEVAELLGPALSDAVGVAGIATIVRQTEGWPAAVRLAQIVLSELDAPRAVLERFSGSDEDIAALLKRQVLSGFPPELKQFLLAVALLPTFCAKLCHHVSGDSRAEEFLAELIRRNVFVIPLDRNRTWYRLHGLFREYLLSEAERAFDGEQRTALRRRAAEWCEQNAYWREAMDYALEGDGLDIASRILERTATAFVRDQGDVRQYIAWVEQLRERGAELGWETQYWYVWALVLHRRYEHGRQQNESLADRVRLAKSGGGLNGAECNRLDDLLRRIELIRSCIGIFTDDLPGACADADRWLAGAAPADDPFDAMAACCARAIHYTSAFQFNEAREAMQQAQPHAFQVNSTYANGWISGLNAMVPLYEGDCLAVYQELTTSIARVRNALGENAGIVGTLSLLAAKCAVEVGLDDEARQLLRTGLRTIKLHGFLDAVACGLEAAVKLWSGDDQAIDDGGPSLAELRDIAATYPPRLAQMLSCHVVQRLLVLGQLDAAQREAARIGLTIDGMESPPGPARGSEIARARDLYAATEIELCIAAGRHKQAELLIVEETRLAKADGRAARLVELALGEATIAARNGSTAAANRHLTRAVSIAATRHVLRPFCDRGPMIAALVADTRPTAWGFALAKERKFFAELCQRLPMSDPTLQERLAELNIDAQLHEALSPRQIELLHLLDAGLSNQQLADRLNLTLSTVKGHLQRLFAKLGVSSRSAALARARAMHLLP